MTNVSVTAGAPDKVVAGQAEVDQINLFLYQVTPNQGWRNHDLPNVDGQNRRVGNNPLALDLHFLVTAYGAVELNAEVLLGHAMQLLHETPVLTRERIRLLLGGPNALSPLPTADLADQVEMVKIIPEYLSTDEMSKIWTSTLAHYRPSMAYVAPVVLIQTEAEVRAAPPVLRQGELDRGPVAVGAPFPTLAGVSNAASAQLPALRLGDDLVLAGSNLTGTGVAEAVLQHSKFGGPRTLSAVPAPGPEGKLLAHLPAPATDAQAMNQWTIGLYNVQVRITRSGIPPWVTGVAPMALSPAITVAPNAATAGTVLTVTCTPRLHPEQEAKTELILGATPIPPDSIDTPVLDTDPTTLTFTVPPVEPGSHQVRLRVDGSFDSLPVTVSGSPPSLSLDPQQVVAVSP